ncbi:hypothetical protein [Leisingera sp. F5]|uniref:hypothetical protein n=1 Tax=Leisingera sp. F5 TaxID=1813816 RepID=UPI0025C6EB2C|nr:hypothetical protein [Leisingera sp. F5]
MPLLLLLLLAGVFGYFLWRRSATGLTRNCRWRQQRAKGQWFCSYCGAVAPGGEAPRFCRNPQRKP